MVVAISLNESEFLLQAIREGKRLDGRTVYAQRAIELSFPSADLGTVECRLGKTRYTTNREPNNAVNSIEF
jgi:exosome complex component RRP45